MFSNCKYSLTFNNCTRKSEYRYRKQIGGCQRQGWWVGEIVEGGQKVHVSSYKINKPWLCNVQHGEYS